MSKRSDLLKSIIKGQVTESPALDKFLKSRGLNPKTVTKDQKVAHSKLGQFKKWERDHATDLTRMGEEVDKKDAVTFDIPLLIRVLELAREDIKSDMDLHRVVERLINMRDKGMLTMDDYDTIANIKENHIAIAMGKMLDDEGSMVLDQLEQLERAITMIRSYVGKDYKKQLPAWVQSKVTLATDYVDTVGNYLSTKNEEASHDPWKDKHFGPTKIIKQKYHVKTDTKSYNVKADNEDHAHKLVTKHAPGCKIVSIEHKGRIMEEVEQIDEEKEYTFHHSSTIKNVNHLKNDKKFVVWHYHKLPSGNHSSVASGGDSMTGHEFLHKIKKREYPDGSFAVDHRDDHLRKLNITNESIEPIDEISKELTHSYLKKRYSQTGATRQDKPKGMPRATHDKQLMGLNRATKRLTTTLELPKGTDPSQGGKYTADSVEIDGTPIQEGSAALRLAQALRKEREARELKDKSREAAEKNEKAKQPTQQQEAALEDPQSATQSPYDCANNPDDTVSKGKKLIQMSKSARIIKSIYKRKGMKEEIYDTEKEGKSIATYGKKPKLSDNEKKIEAVGGKPQAAAIMTGGTTLTGTPRDTVEIDPMMKPPKPGSLGQSDKPKNNNR